MLIKKYQRTDNCYNCGISIGFHSVCYQNDCILRGKPLWMPGSEMIPSLWYWQHHLCWWICWHYTSLEHSLCTDPKTYLPTFQSLDCFNSVGIILITYFLMPKYNKCIGVSAKSRMSMPNSSYFCQTSGPWYSCPCWKASIAFWKPHSLKSNMFSKTPAFHVCSTVCFESDTEHISELGLEIWRLFCKDSTDFLH